MAPDNASLSEIEVASGAPSGRHRSPGAVRRSESPPSLSCQLQDLIARHVRVGTVAVAFSGGRDSTVILGAARQVCAELGADPPIAVTQRVHHVDEHDSDHAWQVKVIRALELERQWHVITTSDAEAHVLGAPALRVVRGHGPLVYAHAFGLWQLAEAAGALGAKTLLTGLDGDRLHVVAATGRTRFRDAPRAIGRDLRSLPTWLSPEGKLRFALGAASARVDPKGHDPATSWGTSRAWEIQSHYAAACERDTGLTVQHVWTPETLKFWTRDAVPVAQVQYRNDFVAWAFQEEWPRGLPMRQDKGRYEGHFSTGPTSPSVSELLASAHTPLDRLIDRTALRRVWASEHPDLRSATFLQYLWKYNS